MKARMIGLKKAGMMMATFALTAGLFFSAKVTAFAASEKESNDSAPTATAISVNEKVDGTMSDRNDVDFYKVTINKPGYISLDFSHDYYASANPWTVTLMDADNEPFYSTDVQLQSKGLTSSAKYGVAAGTYYVKVEGYWTVGHNYAVQVNYKASDAWESEPNGDGSTANKIAVNKQYNGCMYDRNDVDVFKFTVDKPGYVTLDFDHQYDTTSNTWNVQLKSEDNIVLYEKNIPKNTTNKTTSPKYGVAAGTYYVRVEGYWSVGLNYSLKVNYTADDGWESEINDDEKTARKLTFGKSMTGGMYNDNDKDYYKFTVSQPGTVKVNFSNEYELSSRDWYVKLYNPNDPKDRWDDDELYTNRIKLNNTVTVSSDPIEVGAGTYYVYVDGWGTVGHNYTISVDYESTNAQLSAFVTRMYEVVLGRTPDAAGLNDWVGKLSRGEANAVDIVFGFVNSDEYKNKGKSNGEIVNDCYHAMLGRDADEGGYNDWVGRLDNGMSVNAILAGFVGSEEFGNLCKTYGIQPGSYTCAEARDQNLGVTSYVARLYTQALGRNFDPNGLNDWCGQINANPSRDNIIQVAANGFFHSQEFLNKGLNNEEYVKVLYRTFLGRECDPNGLADWVGQLDRGEKSRDEILPGFANSQEFSGIMAQYGL